MFQNLKKAFKISAVCIFLVLAVFTVLYVYVYVKDPVLEAVKNKNTVSFSLLIYDENGTSAHRLCSCQIMYDCRNDVLKILRVNSDVVVSKRRAYVKSLKTLFYENLEKDLNGNIDKFYLNLYKIIGPAALSDFYIRMSFKTFNNIFGRDKNIKSLLNTDKSADADIESLNCFEILERVLYLIPYRFFKIQRNYKYIDTNIPRLSLITSFNIVRRHKPGIKIMFCEMPVKYGNMYTEPDNHDIKEFLDKVYFKNSYADEKYIIVDVKNASKQHRMAEKAAWLLRANKFDVLDWESSPYMHSETIIKDYRGNFMQALKIAGILGAGRVIVSYNSSTYVDITVSIGRDCRIYDGLDKKIGGKNGGRH
ncbi:MAG: LytR C-terminal domain-containing protein [Endomicrobium sp.]|jgi:hypothetical protein|nr:LytR C-terminal domain-containing protein [Endomicrobium sp.]